MSETIKARRTRASATVGYGPYIAFESEGHGRYAVMTCLRCGAAVLLDSDEAPRIHDRWHAETGGTNDEM